MGIHKFIEEFGLEKANVDMDKGNIYIGNGYVHDFVTVKPDGTIKKNSIVDGDGFWMDTYNKLQATPKTHILQLINSEDVFEAALIPVYSSKKGKVIKQYCTEFGYSNTTTDGELMYDNTHFKTRDEALKSAIKNTELSSYFEYYFKDDLSSLYRILRKPVVLLLRYIRTRVFRGFV